ncbi:MAG: hypothetical protein Q8L55_03065, partial [Phycisphaerales bacterium]|nr:hypothetical protein [Phycisphaerales bacterium]
MILAAIISIYGLIFLIRGKGMGKDAVAHPHYRLLGGFLLTFIPVQLVLGLLLGIVIAVSSPDTTEEGFKDKLTLPSFALSL